MKYCTCRVVHGERAHALADVSNLQHHVVPDKPKNKRTIKNKTTATKTDNIPNFESFEKHDLVVQSVTPLKTHVSISPSNSEDNWDNYATQELLDELADPRLALGGLVSSSPCPNNVRRQLPRSPNISALVSTSSISHHSQTHRLLRKDKDVRLNYSHTTLDSVELHVDVCGGHELSDEVVVGGGMHDLSPNFKGVSSSSAAHVDSTQSSCTSSDTHGTSVHSSRPTNTFHRGTSSVRADDDLPISMQTRRAKRLRKITGDRSNVSTSTPEQLYRKMSRYEP